MALKRAGRGHDPAGIMSTSPGGLTVECPACPHPGRNLPDDWQQAGPHMCVPPLFLSFNILTTCIRFLYILYISVDANFKLKGKERGLKDVDLMPGWGSFVEDSAYHGFIGNHVDQPEVSRFSPSDILLQIFF